MSNENEKPLLRHCRNCEWSKKGGCYEVECTVRYKKYDYFLGLRAEICRFFKLKKVGN